LTTPFDLAAKFGIGEAVHLLLSTWLCDADRKKLFFYLKKTSLLRYGSGSAHSNCVLVTYKVIVISR